jgi:tRNA G18 (ribose-2'-O)-methylase SpoU
MEKSAKTISLRKFARLSVKSRHELLAELAELHLKRLDVSGFLSRYDELCASVEVDRYIPASWLTPQEVLLEARAFHRIFFSVQEEDNQILDRSWTPRLPLSLVLEGVRSPYNLGAMFRLCDNFGLEGIITNSKNPGPNHPRCRKSARGAQHWIPFQVQQNLIAFLESRKRPLIALELTPNSVPVHLWNPPDSFDLVLGSEACGISSALLKSADKIISIPMYGYKNSMNVTHALAVLLTRL